MRSRHRVVPSAAAVVVAALPALPATSRAQSDMTDSSRSVAAAAERPARAIPVAALGPRDGRLAPCPATPNCVSSYERDDWAMPAIPYLGDRRATEARLLRALGEMPRVKVARRDGDYLRAEFTSRIFRFVDDVEFLFDDAARVVHFRSASRVGRSDLGVNRRRMADITARMRGP